ncbi:MAG: hypothetical protein WAL98_15850 [Desulfatiglandaceae bacterium]|jgi:hypothetical protein
MTENTENIVRRSPIHFGRAPARTEQRDGWEVVLSYGEGRGPFLIDLSHRAKWDIQDADITSFKPFGLSVPENPGQCRYEKGILINRMNRTQCAVWHLSGKRPDSPDDEAYTETTDGLTLLAVTGKNVLALMEHVTTLDLGAPGLETPCLIQGPILHIPCQVVLFSRKEEETTILFSFSRGYGQSMAEAMLHAGKNFELTPGGESDLTIIS